MRYIWEDNIKVRLTDRKKLLLAVEKLLACGVPEDLIPVRLAHAFYVDMDELNSVLDAIHVNAERREPSMENTFRAVA